MTKQKTITLLPREEIYHGKLFDSFIPEREYSILREEDLDLQKYEEYVLSIYKNKKARETLLGLTIEDGEITNQSPFRLIALRDSGLMGKSTRPASFNETLKAVRLDKELIRNRVDMGILLQQGQDVNPRNVTLWENLICDARQVDPYREILEKGKGILLSYSSLGIKEDKNAEQGLVFTLNHHSIDAFIEEVSCLGGCFSDYRGKDISRVILNRGKYLYGSPFEFAGSIEGNEGGRIPVVRSIY